MNSSGYCKLFNFGDITYSKDNTIITNQSYDEDYLSLAIIICQMLTGNMSITTKNDLKEISSFDICNEAKQLVVNNILAKKYQDIKKSSLFWTIDWIKLEKGRLTPPFKPEIVNRILFYFILNIFFKKIYSKLEIRFRYI